MLDRIGGLLGRVGEIVRSCHERWDGKGYPDGLKGEDIPLAARVVFVCDAYNAMTTTRPYRAALPARRRRSTELVSNAGTQFDPMVVGGDAAGPRGGPGRGAGRASRSARCSPAPRSATRSAPLRSRPAGSGFSAAGLGAAPAPSRRSTGRAARRSRTRRPAGRRRRRSSASRGCRCRTASGLRTRNEMPNAQETTVSLTAKMRPWRCSGTTAWISRRSCTSSRPLPKPGDAEREPARSRGPARRPTPASRRPSRTPPGGSAA